MNDDTVILDFSELKFPTKEEVKKKVIRRRDLYKEVNEYTLDGVYVTTHASTGVAARVHSISSSAILESCKGTRLCCTKVSRIFLYRGDDIEDRMKRLEGKAEDNYKRGMWNMVDMYSMDGKLLNRYTTVKETHRYNPTISVNIIRSCCEGKRLFVEDKIFLFKDASIEERLQLIKDNAYKLYLPETFGSKARPIDEYDLQGEFIKTWPSAESAARFYGIKECSQVYNCCKGIAPDGKNCYTAKGRIFLYTGDSISERLKLIEGNRMKYTKFKNQKKTKK